MVMERGGMDLMPEQGTRPVNKYLPPRPRKSLAASAADIATGRETRTARQASSPGWTACWTGFDMHPAPSIIVFTTLSGLGYGLAAVLGLGLLDPSLALPPRSRMCWPC